MSQTTQDIPTDQIARRAYEIWESRGRPAGDGSDDWDAALAEFHARRNSQRGIVGWWQRLRQKISGGDG
jgi:hypothetical protein